MRALTSTTQLDEAYLDFPGAKQCFKLTRTRTLRDRATGQARTAVETAVETAYGVTSLPRERADAARLLSVVREHWWIENKAFHVRDQTLGEDACRVRKRAAPVIFSTLRNSVLTVLQTLNVTNRAAQLRTFCANPVKVLQAVHRKITEK